MGRACQERGHVNDLAGFERLVGGQADQERPGSVVVVGVATQRILGRLAEERLEQTLVATAVALSEFTLKNCLRWLPSKRRPISLAKGRHCHYMLTKFVAFSN